jgi:hypothetical protein
LATYSVATILHDPQSHAGSAWHVDRKAFAVVSNSQTKLRGDPTQFDVDTLGLTVVDGVVNSFLRQAVQVERGGQIKRQCG